MPIASAAHSKPHKTMRAHARARINSVSQAITGTKAVIPDQGPLDAKTAPATDILDTPSPTAGGGHDESATQAILHLHGLGRQGDFILDLADQPSCNDGSQAPAHHDVGEGAITRSAARLLDEAEDDGRTQRCEDLRRGNRHVVDAKDDA